MFIIVINTFVVAVVTLLLRDPKTGASFVKTATIMRRGMSFGVQLLKYQILNSNNQQKYVKYYFSYIHLIMCNFKRKSSGFSRFGGNIFLEYQTSNSICNHDKENVKSEFLEFFELLDHFNKWWKFVWYKFIHGAYFWSVGVGTTSPLSPNSHCHQSGGGPATDSGESRFLRHLHEWCRT